MHADIEGIHSHYMPSLFQSKQITDSLSFIIQNPYLSAGRMMHESLLGDTFNWEVTGAKATGFTSDSQSC